MWPNHIHKHDMGVKRPQQILLQRYTGNITQSFNRYQVCIADITSKCMNDYENIITKKVSI